MGGSVYWMVDMAEKVCFMAGVLTGMLVWATGIWERGIRWPRRWLGISNRGLRGFNCKLVITKRPLLVELFSTIVFFFTYGAFSSTAGQYRYIDPLILREVDRELNINRQEHPTLPYVTVGDEEKGGHEEDLAPGGDYVKLLLLAKPFSPNFRENWELYRTEYWDKENERRNLIRTKLEAHDKKIVKERYGWRWWLPGYRSAARIRPAHEESEKHHHAPHLHHAHHHRAASISKEEKRTRSASLRRNSSSAGSTRSRTPSAEVADDGNTVSRQASVSSNASDKKRKKHLSTGSRSKRESRSLTPEYSSPLAQASKASDEVA
ncbi:Spo7-like protein-domain-containing protein, partial [Microdochium bolleyi]